MNFFEPTTNVYLPVTDGAITEDEVMKAFRDQKKGYNYTNTILRPFISILLPYILILMNTIFFATNEVISWAASMLFSVPKKRNLEVCEKLERNTNG